MNKWQPLKIFTLLLVCVAGVAPEPSQEANPIPDELVVLTFDDSTKSHFTVFRRMSKV